MKNKEDNVKTTNDKQKDENKQKDKKKKEKKGKKEKKENRDQTPVPKNLFDDKELKTKNYTLTLKKYRRKNIPLNTTDLKKNLILVKNIQFYTNKTGYNYDPNLEINKKYTFPKEQKVIIHTFWDGVFDRLQLLSLKSFLISQKNYTYDMWIFIPNRTLLKENINKKEIKELMKIFPNIYFKLWDFNKEINNTIFQSIDWFFNATTKKSFIADNFRIISLYKYGGLYFDFDIVFLRDLSPLFKNDFFLQWMSDNFGNNAVLYFNNDKNNIEYIAKKAIKLKTFQPWILFNYNDPNLKNMAVLPNYVFDPMWKIYKPIFKRFNDFFRNNTEKYQNITLKNFFPNSYGYHWHNRWQKEILPNSPAEILEREINETIKNMTMIIN